MKQLFWLSLFLLFANPLFAANRDEAISNFSSTILVNKDGSLDVTERIQLYADQHKIRHGITRRLPQNYIDSEGMKHDAQYHVTQILINDKPAPYYINFVDHQFTIYVGQQEVALPSGDYTFVLQYHVLHALSILQDQDQLYWNVTGNDWDFPIMKAEATVTLPDSAPILRYAGFTGKIGLREQNFTVTQAAPNQIYFATSQILKPGQGFTVGVSWPKGAIATPALPSNIFYTGLRITFEFLIFIFLASLLTWLLLRKKDSKPGKSESTG